MTYVTDRPLPGKMNIIALHNVSGTATVGFVVKPQSSNTMIGDPETTFNTSTGIITLPDRPCVLNAGLMYYENTNPSPPYQYCDFQWYDETNSQYIGNKARLRGYGHDFYYDYETLSCDEQAIAIAQNINVSLKIIAVRHTSLVLDGTGSQEIYAGSTRFLIYEF